MMESKGTQMMMDHVCGSEEIGKTNHDSFALYKSTIDREWSSLLCMKNP